MTDQQMLHFNGMDITTGKPLTAPMAMDVFAVAAQKHMAQQVMAVQQPAVAAAAAGIVGGLSATSAAPAIQPSFDPTRLEEAGWGVIFAQNIDPAIRDALRPLLELRKAQVSRLSPQRYKEYSGPNAWRSLESADDFLERHGATPGVVNPDHVPYYLLIVADPMAVVYRQQFDLDVLRAVGRIHFDTLEEYAGYARSVVAAESGSRVVPRRAVLFASTNDQTTQLSCDRLAIPLASRLKADRPAWRVDSITAGDATKARFNQLLTGGDPAALLFTATHGGYLPFAHPLQSKRQGCLICQGFDREKVGADSYNPAEFYFSGEDVADAAQIPPMITFHFACFGAGTPQMDQFLLREGRRLADAFPQLARQPFVAYLPQRLLGHPNGGALATIGHVERAWGFNFDAEHADDIAIFEHALTAIMDGSQVGHAMQMFGERYSQLNKALAKAPDKRSADYVKLWTAGKDARNYVIVGDPAVRLPLSAAGEQS